MTARGGPGRSAALAVLLLGSLTACRGGADGGPPPAATSAPQDVRGPLTTYEFGIFPLSGSDVRGEASLETLRGGEGSRLILSLEGAGDGPLALHTHSGPCSARATTPTHDLDPVVEGKADIEISAAVQGLTHGNFNMSVHENGDGDSPHIACGAISGPPSDE